MKKQLLKLGNELNKKEQQIINGGDQCPPFNCYYGNSSTPLNNGATYCGTCEDYNALPSECKFRVMVGDYCFGM
ncbi:hypothetical protein ACQY1Q_11995 [Tenacibaculum sp. TC6]|uniref:hypothetical protein n=1 Tax=Tenacibaculum sp. TC6 TaxID=3423223 RepID=UPI003D35BE3C